MGNDAMNARLDRLQRQVAFWRAWVVIATIASIVGVVSHLAAAPTRIDATAVVAQEFDMVNAAGRVTAQADGRDWEPQPSVRVRAQGLAPRTV